MCDQIPQLNSWASDIFSHEGNRRRGYKCGPCAQYKKGCKGNPPVCDTCVKYNRGQQCKFAAVVPNHTKAQQTEKPVSASDDEQKSEVTKRDPNQSQYFLTEDDSQKRSKANHHTAIADGQNLYAASKSLSRYSNHEQYVEKMPSNIILSKEEYNARIAAARSHLQYSDLVSIRRQRDNQQKRRVNALHPEEIGRIADPVTKEFVQRYAQPFSRNLLPIVEGIVSEIRATDAAADAKTQLRALKAKFNQVWDLFLAYSNDALGLTEFYSRHMSEEKRVAWLRQQSPKPVTEHEVEEFLFAYVCLSLDGWDANDSKLAMARWCYVKYIDDHYEYLKACLDWHEEMQMVYSWRVEWLKEWLQKKIDGDDNLTDIVSGTDKVKTMGGTTVQEKTD